jgi:hypothetical protein
VVIASSRSLNKGRPRSSRPRKGQFFRRQAVAGYPNDPVEHAYGNRAGRELIVGATNEDVGYDRITPKVGSFRQRQQPSSHGEPSDH